MTIKLTVKVRGRKMRKKNQKEKQIKRKKREIIDDKDLIRCLAVPVLWLPPSLTAAAVEEAKPRKQNWFPAISTIILFDN
jgi:hypothetical protein